MGQDKTVRIRDGKEKHDCVLSFSNILSPEEDKEVYCLMSATGKILQKTAHNETGKSQFFPKTS